MAKIARREFPLARMLRSLVAAIKKRNCATLVVEAMGNHVMEFAA